MTNVEDVESIRALEELRNYFFLPNFTASSLRIESILIRVLFFSLFLQVMMEFCNASVLDHYGLGKTRLVFVNNL